MPIWGLEVPLICAWTCPDDWCFRCIHRFLKFRDHRQGARNEGT